MIRFGSGFFLIELLLLWSSFWIMNGGNIRFLEFVYGSFGHFLGINIDISWLSYEIFDEKRYQLEWVQYRNVYRRSFSLLYILSIVKYIRGGWSILIDITKIRILVDTDSTTNPILFHRHQFPMFDRTNKTL